MTRKRIVAFLLLAAMLAGSAPNISTEAAKQKPVKLKSVTLKIGKKTVTKMTYSLKKGKKATVKATVTPAKAKKSVTFKSSSSKIAAVSKKGVITAKKAGTAKITVTVKGKNKDKKSAWLKVKVTDKKPTPTPPPTPPTPTPEKRVIADSTKTYCNPLALPNLELRAGQPTASGWFQKLPATEEEIDFGIDKAKEFLAKDTWTDADGRSMTRISSIPVPSDHNFRTAADPTAFFVGDTCYLYASGDCGDTNNLNCWSTKDFITWEYQDIGFGVIAPSVIQVGNKFYMAGNGTPVYEADNPLGPWKELGKFTLPDGTETGFSDVCFFLDDDGRLYLSYSIGCPIMGCELDPKNPSKILTDPIPLFTYDNSRSWTRYGSSFQNDTCGYCEGSQIFKYNGTYYLQVASNGTENASYCIGVLKSTEGPLSGYTDQENNPITIKEDGFLPGPGHGLFVTNPKNNVLMLFYTSVLGHSRSCFNRRISMDVCKIDANGNITVNTTTTPQITPNNLPNGFSLSGSGTSDSGLRCLNKWMSYWSNNKENLTDAFYAVDGSMNTWWEPDHENPVLISGLCGIYDVSALQICWQELGCEYTRANAVKFKVEYKNLDTGEWTTLVDKSSNTAPMADEYITFKPVRTVAVRLSILGSTENIDVGVSEFRVFGENLTLATEKGM